MKQIIAILFLVLLGGCATTQNPQTTKFLVATTKPGETIQRQGTQVAIGRLNPIFQRRLAATIADARRQGMDVGISSAYRPPIFNIGGYVDKFNSLHAYGLASDIYGLGGPDDPRAEKFYRIARKHRLWNPYHGTRSWGWEYNHYQLFRHIKKIPANYNLRKTITAKGPVDPNVMWREGNKIFVFQWIY